MRKRELPWGRQRLSSPQWAQGLRKWCLVLEMFALSSWLRNLSGILVSRQRANYYQRGIVSLGWGGGTQRGKISQQHPNGIRCHPGKAISHLLSLLPTWKLTYFLAPRFPGTTTEHRDLLKTNCGGASLCPLQNLFHKPYGFALLVRRLYEASGSESTMACVSRKLIG